MMHGQQNIKFIDCRTVHLLLLLELAFIIMHAKNHVQVINAQHERMIHHYIDNKEKLFETNLALWFNKILSFEHFKPCTIDIKTKVRLL
jgi:hypothetical protein